MELQRYVEQFRKQGLGVCAILYDSAEILADFAKRRSITFPLLSDPQSKIIRDFGILNTSVPRDHGQYGIPYPGTYIVDRNGIVKSKYFESLYRDRYTAPTILLREFGSVAGTRETIVKTDHLELKYFSTQDVVRPNLHFTLVVDFQLPPKMHVYAPEVQSYIPIRLELDSSPYYKPLPVEYPKWEAMYLPAIQETVPVYQGSFRVTQDIKMEEGSVLNPILAGNRELTIKGQLRYQACDDKICYLPQNIPVEWVLKVEMFDRERVPKPIQHKAAASAEK